MVFTPGTVRRLMPFSLSLLQGSGVRLRLVANGCGPEEVRLLAETAAANEALSHHVLPAAETVQHGAALNHLFEEFPDEPYFAFADSDVIAGGDFIPALLPMAPHQAGVCAAEPVWATEVERIVPDGWPVLSGRMNVLPDGTDAGSTYLAIYERRAVEPVWRRAPRGFQLHFYPGLPRAIRAELKARGWDYRIFDTCRLVNLQLILEGRTLETRAVSQLHHVGGLSGTRFLGPMAVVRNLQLLIRSKAHRRPKPIAEYLAFRLLLWRRLRDPQQQRLNERRSVVSGHVRAALDALEAGEPVPPVPSTGSAHVDERLAALSAALQAHYRPL